MNEHELKIALCKQAKVLLQEAKANSGKKVVLKMETIQLFSKLQLSEFPKTKADIDKVVENLDEMIKKEEALNAE